MLTRLRGEPEYVRQFNGAFPDGITAQNLAKGLAAFERTLLSGNSPVDRFRNAEFPALSDTARQGLWLFESRGLCWKCHSGGISPMINFTTPA